jgi:lipoate-protein ligase A
MIILFSPSHIPAFNLAAEEYLFFQSEEDILFLYVNDPSVIIGNNQAIRNEVNLEFCDENNISVIRRMSGGGAVYHDHGNLNYCFISNKVEGRSALSDDFLTPVVAVLAELDLPVTVGRRKDLWLDKTYKISGTASHVGKIRELHHGTLLYDANLEHLETALRPKTVDTTIKAIPSVRSTVKNMRTWLAEHGNSTLEPEAFFALLTKKFQHLLQVNELTRFSNDELSAIHTLAQTKYVSEDWTFRK